MLKYIVVIALFCYPAYGLGGTECVGSGAQPPDISAGSSGDTRNSRAPCTITGRNVDSLVIDDNQAVDWYFPWTMGNDLNCAWSEANLPSELSIDSLTGRVTGSSVTAGTYAGVAITCTNAHGANTETLTLTVNATAGGDNNYANGENRCDILGANCVCSEPMSADFYNHNFGQTAEQLYNGGNTTVLAWDPTDTTSKECTVPTSSQFASTYARNMRPDTDATALAALPNASITSFLGKPFDYPTNNQTGIFDLGHDTGTALSYVRRAWRWYTYYSPNFLFCTAQSNQNSKLHITQLFNRGQEYHTWGTWNVSGGYWSLSGGNQSVYELASLGTTIGGRILGSMGPSHARQSDWPVGHEPPGEVQGHWFRFEYVIDNGDINQTAGAGLRARLYMKNITLDTPEIKLIDSYCPAHTVAGYDAECTHSSNIDMDFPWPHVNWDGALRDDLRITDQSPGEYHYVQNFNEGAFGNPCLGSDGNGAWEGQSHYLNAVWDASDMSGYDLYGADVWNETDYRIGSASEMEGVAGQIDP